MIVEHVDHTLQMQSEDATGTKMPPCDQKPPHPPFACMQAVERVRITVQLRRLANSSRPESGSAPFSASQATPIPEGHGKSPRKPGRASSSMSLESMRSVMSNLRSKSKSQTAAASDLGRGS